MIEQLWKVVWSLIQEYASVGTLVFSIASDVMIVVCFVHILRTRKEHRKRFAETKADTTSLKNQIEKMRQSPPRLRVPFDERLKAEYKKRGL
jgi:hypothetical protein